MEGGDIEVDNLPNPVDQTGEIAALMKMVSDLSVHIQRIEEKVVQPVVVPPAEKKADNGGFHTCKSEFQQVGFCRTPTGKIKIMAFIFF